MALDTNINQFKQGVAIGDLDLKYFGGESRISCLYNPEATSTDRLKAGESVLLKDLGADDVAGPPIIDKRGTELVTIFGTVVRSLKQSEFAPGDIVEIAVSGACMFLKASGALSRGVAVTPVLATVGSVKAVSTKTHYGITLDKIADAGIGRVLIQADGVAVGSA
jgi:hypothetical protein